MTTMENKKPSFFSSLRQDLVRGLSPMRGRKKKKSPSHVADPEPSIGRSSSSSVGGGEALATLVEGPDPDGGADTKRVGLGIGHWMKRAHSGKRVGSGRDLRLMLGVMGAPLAPVYVSSRQPMPHLCIKDTPIETSFAQYIIQQYIAASGGQKMQRYVRNAYALGKFKMLVTEIETAARVTKIGNTSRDAELGGFVLWQMNPDMWYVELAVGGSKVHAGCNGKLVWRHTPWVGAHTAKGPARPLRRALQGLDPRTIAGMFADARCVGEKTINGEDCFILKLSADPQTLKARSEGLSEIIRHVLFGYFSQKTGLLVDIEDSHLTRIQSNGGDVVYYETTISSFLDDYRPVEGIMIPHSGRSVVTLFKFGEIAMSHTKTRMQEIWEIDEVAFNVPGLSVDCFIPPGDLKSRSSVEAREILKEERGKSRYRSKIAVSDKSLEI